jgi:hypothetical protein
VGKSGQVPAIFNLPAELQRFTKNFSKFAQYLWELAGIHHGPSAPSATWMTHHAT